MACLSCHRPLVVLTLGRCTPLYLGHCCHRTFCLVIRWPRVRRNCMDKVACVSQTFASFISVGNYSDAPVSNVTVKVPKQTC